MDIVEWLIEDHHYFRAYLGRLIKKVESLPPQSPPPSSTEADEAFSQRLRRHARVESEILFPALQRAGSDRTRQQIVTHYLAHGNDEHASIAKRQAVIHETARSGTLEQWRTAVLHFYRGMINHFNMEELEIFPTAQILPQKNLVDLTEKIKTIP